MSQTGSERGFRLLPPDRYLGWTPYIWLVYLTVFLISPIARTASGRGSFALWAGTIPGVVFFLVTYFRGYWESGGRLLAIVVAQAALGAVYAPFNYGSVVFFIYAAAFAGRLDRSRVAIHAIATLTAAAAVLVWILDMPASIWIFGVAFIPIIGGVNLHQTRVQRADGRLRLAQKEVRHLAAVAERERIARDLHDVLGHTLSLIVLKSELAAKLIKQDPARAGEEIRDVEYVSRDALRDVREAIGGYRASLADELARSRSLLDAAGVRPDVDLDVADAGPGGRSESVLALALREAVTNVARHAEAGACRIRVTVDRGNYILEVEDDGRGVEGDEGSGLRGMRERVRSLGGTLEVGPRLAGRGTRVRITVPAATAGAPGTAAHGT